MDAISLMGMDIGACCAQNGISREAVPMGAHTAVPENRRRKASSNVGATEEQVDMKDTVPQRIDRKGTKVEDIAGNGEHDSAGG
jgi:hypothetical protein